MIIGIDAVTFNYSKKTGVEWYAYHLIKEFIRTPSKNNFVLYSSSKLNISLPTNWENRILKWPFKYLWSQIRFSFEMIFKKPDVLFVPVRALPIFCPQKSVFVVHDLGYEVFPKSYSFWRRNYIRFVYQQALRKAKKILVPSEFTKQELIRFYNADPFKIKVIFEGYDQEIFKTNKDQQKNREVLKKYQIKKPFLFYLGRKEKKKNTLGLIKAFQILQKKFPDLELVLVGLEGFGYQKIKNEILKTKRVKELDYLPVENLPSLYQEAEAFVFPSFYEGFGLPLLEAMACECPVIASQAGSLKEIGKEAIIYFNPNNIGDIAEKIEMVLINQNLKNDLKKKGLIRIKDFSWQKCAEQTMKEIEKF